MKKNISILIALLTIGTAAIAQERKASAPTKPVAPVKQDNFVSTSRSNIKHGSISKVDKKPVAPVKQETAIVTSRSNIKHHPQAVTNKKGKGKPGKQELLGINTSRSNIKHQNSATTGHGTTTVKQETKSSVKR